MENKESILTVSQEAWKKAVKAAKKEELELKKHRENGCSLDGCDCSLGDKG